MFQCLLKTPGLKGSDGIFYHCYCSMQIESSLEEIAMGRKQNILGKEEKTEKVEMIW